MSLQLSEHGYSNDGDLDLESFRYELDLHTQWAAAHRRTVQVPALLMAAAVLQTHLGVGGLVVWDLGTLLARYEPRRSRHAGHAAAGTQVAVDVLSGTSPEDFPAHLAAVLCRMPG
jgi:hypothetical protein